jgi:type II secretory ATPase GspE/PulE/Tfp pilus assembly ATPase PilB-like protein
MSVTLAPTRKPPQPLRDLLELEGFKGLVYGVQPQTTTPSVLVLDMGCAEVILVMKAEYFGSGGYFGLCAVLSSHRFLMTIKGEFFADTALMDELMALHEKKTNSRHSVEVISESNKNIVLYDEIITRSMDLNATDVHWEIRNGERSQVRLRIDGRLMRWKSFPTDLLRGALSAAYSARSKSGTNSAGALSLERAMNTMTENTVKGQVVNGRFNGIPLVNGYDVVIRLLKNDPRLQIPSIESLGYTEHHIHHQILPAIAKNSGMMAIAGSTGSGKSTALRSFIACLPNLEVLKVFGVEDPVEYLNPFMSQISIQRSTDDADEVVKMKFLSALRSVLRMDPDVLMLGEIRDKESASLASEFNRTGHRVFTTVHGDGCVDVLTRLNSPEIGISASTLGSRKFLSAVMYQKLLPKLCPHCKVPASTVLESTKLQLLFEKFGLNVNLMFCANDEGCAHCRIQEVAMAGTKGLTVVAEILIPTPEILKGIASSDWTWVEHLWRSSRTAPFDSPNMQGKTAFEHALYQASLGLIDPQDIERDFESFDTYQILDFQTKESLHVESN